MTRSAEARGGPAGSPEEAALSAVAARLVNLAEASPCNEVCGLVVVRADGVPEVRPLRNAAPAPARSFALAAPDLLAFMRHLERVGGDLLAIYHSHPSGGADLSAADLAELLCDGEPLWPGAAQVVVGLVEGLATVVRAHRWEGDRYRPVDLWRRDRHEAPADPPVPPRGRASNDP